jgi:hypothetical protein
LNCTMLIGMQRLSPEMQAASMDMDVLTAILEKRPAEHQRTIRIGIRSMNPRLVRLTRFESNHPVPSALIFCRGLLLAFVRNRSDECVVRCTQHKGEQI